MPRCVPVLALGLLALVGGCKKKIGDPCTRSTDCSIHGERTCDLSHRVDSTGVPTPGGQGECTIESCGANSCPKEGECVKVYGSAFLTVACDPNREDKASFGRDDDCTTQRACTMLEAEETCEEVCPEGSDAPECLDRVCPPVDDCKANEVCLPEGLCADEITARSSCRRRCKKDKDCRPGYECESTGSRGVYHAPDLGHPGYLDDVKICMPRSL